MNATGDQAQPPTTSNGPMWDSKILEGDLRRLYGYRVLVTGRVEGMLPGRLRLEAENIFDAAVDKTIAFVLRERSDGRTPSGLYTYLRKAAHGLTVDLLRRTYGRVRSAAFPADYLHHQVEEVVSTAERQQDAENFVRAMELAPSVLSLKELRVLTLRLQEDCSTAETAAQLNISMNDVAVTLHRALKKLAGILPPPDPTDGPGGGLNRAMIEKAVRERSSGMNLTFSDRQTLDDSFTDLCRKIVDSLASRNKHANTERESWQIVCDVIAQLWGSQCAIDNPRLWSRNTMPFYLKARLTHERILMTKDPERALEATLRIYAKWCTANGITMFFHTPRANTTPTPDASSIRRNESETGVSGTSGVLSGRTVSPFDANMIDDDNDWFDADGFPDRTEPYIDENGDGSYVLSDDNDNDAFFRWTGLPSCVEGNISKALFVDDDEDGNRTHTGDDRINVWFDATEGVHPNRGRHECNHHPVRGSVIQSLRSSADPSSNERAGMNAREMASDADREDPCLNHRRPQSGDHAYMLAAGGGEAFPVETRVDKPDNQDGVRNKEGARMNWRGGCTEDNVIFVAIQRRKVTAPLLLTRAPYQAWYGSRRGNPSLN